MVNRDGEHSYHLAGAVSARFEKRALLRRRADKIQRSAVVREKEDHADHRLSDVSGSGSVSRPRDPEWHDRDQDIVKNNIEHSARDREPEPEPRSSRRDEKYLKNYARHGERYHEKYRHRVCLTERV